MNALDPHVTRQLSDDLAPDVFRMILQTFANDLSRLVAEIVAAGKAGDQEGYERAAHSIAGTAAGIGAAGLEREARLAMDRRQVAQTDAILARIQAEMERVHMALRLFLD